MRDRPAVLWLIGAALTAALHPVVPDATWLMVHMIALGGLTHSIMVWSAHFAATLLKHHPDIDVRATQNRRLVLLHLGILAVLVGVPTRWWWLTTLGAVAIGTAVVWHAWQLVRRLRGALPGRFRVVIHHYLAAAACLPVGATLGVLLARGPGEEMHARLLLAHSLVNVLGWVGLTIVGTLLTLWPTILRARMDAAAEGRARQALPALVLGLTATLGGALLGWRWLLLAGITGYLLALLWSGRSLVAPARQKPPKHFASWSVLAGATWFLVGIGMVGRRVATAPDIAAMATGYSRVAAVLVIGFGLQVLCGALSHLVPAVIGGGPRVVRVGIEGFDRLGMTRIVLINLPFALALLPLPSATRTLLAGLVLVGLASFVPVLLTTIRRLVVTRREAALATPEERRAGLEQGRADAARVLDPPFPRTQLMAGVTLVALALAAGAGLQPALDDRPATAAVEPTGHTTRVDVTATADMSFSPSSVEVPAGDRLVITLTSEDGSTVHDLHFDDETATPRLTKGETATLDLGIVGADRQGWCTVAGHRAMGMTFDVVVTGADATASDGHDHGTHADHDGGDTPFALDPTASWPEDFTADDATLPPLSDERTHRVTLRVRELDVEVAPGVSRTRWTFGGTAPGPTLHGRVGDRFVVTLVNDGTIGHSIDFHAGALAPDRPMRTIAPGQRLTYTFTAERAGVWMYHCSTMPMSTHIAQGMFGAVVIEPPDLPEVDRSYLLVQSEVHVDGDGRSEVREVDAPAVAADAQPDLMTFNGIANQYDHRPLTARVGERVRIWALDAGPNRASSLHVVGGQFDTVYKEGAYLLRGGRDAFGSEDGGSQALGLEAAQGGFVELVMPEAGTYPVVTHVMADAERGAHALLRVTP